MELVLIALGGCTGSDVAIILEKKRVRFSKFEMKITGERAAEDPKVYTTIHIDYRVEGVDLREKDIAHAIELSMTKYCSVSAMLKKSVALTYSSHDCRSGCSGGISSSRQIDISQLDDFLLNSPDIVVELLNDGTVVCVELLPRNDVCTDLDRGEGIVEFVADRDDEFLDRLVSFLTENLVLFHLRNLFF